MFVAEAVGGGDKLGRGQLRVGERRVVEGREDQPGDGASVAGKERLQRGDVVEGEVVDVRAVFGDESAVAGGAPGGRAVVGAADFEDLGATRDFAGDHDRPVGEVGAVFGEDGPIGEVDAGGEFLGEFDEEGRGVVEGRAEAAGGLDGGFNFGVVVAEDEWAVAAHEVDELIAVHVTVAAAVALGREIGDRARHGGGGRGVSVDTAGNHGGGAAEEGLGVGEVQRGGAGFHLILVLFLGLRRRRRGEAGGRGERERVRERERF